MPKKILDLSLDEVSEVDRPAQKGALARIMKGEDAPRVVAIAKRYFDADEGAVSFVDRYRECMTEKLRHEAREVVYPALDALHQSMTSIVGDAGLTANEKQARAEQNAADFIQTLRSLLPEVQDELMQAVEKASNEAGDQPVRTEVSMSDNPDQVAELEAKLADLEKSVDTLTAERDEAVQKAAMSDAEKAYMDKLPEGERKAFMGLNQNERKARMRKAEEADETVEIDGQTIAKSAVGDATFAVMKSQAERIAAVEKQAAEDRENADLARLEKRASEEFSHVPGEPAALAKALRAIASIEDEDVRKSIEAVFTQAEKMAKGAFDTVGHSDGSVSKARGDFKAKVAEIAKRDGVDQASAMSKARQEYPDEYEAAYGGQN